MVRTDVVRKAISSVMQRETARQCRAEGCTCARLPRPAVLSLLRVAPGSLDGVDMCTSELQLLDSMLNSYYVAFSFTDGQWRSYRQWPFAYSETDFRRRTRNLPQI